MWVNGDGGRENIGCAGAITVDGATEQHACAPSAGARMVNTGIRYDFMLL
jgi:hypothetical protein